MRAHTCTGTHCHLMQLKILPKLEEAMGSELKANVYLNYYMVIQYKDYF